MIGYSQNSGCTDSLAYNYDSLAVIDDGSCLYLGCFYSQIGQDIEGNYSDRSGASVSLSSDGTTIAIGAPGSIPFFYGQVLIYKNISGTWTQVGQDINDEHYGDRSGFSVSISEDGNIVAIGAPVNAGNGNSSGHVRVYENIGGTWFKIGQDIDGESSGDNSGFSVSLSGDGSIVAIGAPYNAGNGTNSGHVRIYENIGGNWSQIGQDINGENAFNRSGYSVSLSSDGNIVAIGAIDNNGNGNSSGHVRVYKNISGNWSQIGQDIDGEENNIMSGFSVSLSSDGNIVAIGAPFNIGNGVNASGHVRIYENVSGNWSQIGQDIDGDNIFDQSGYSVSLSSDGSIVAIGANQTDFHHTDQGHVRIYENIGGTWFKIGQDINGENEGDKSGSSVSLSSDGKTVAIGAPLNDDSGIESGHVRIYDNFTTVLENSFVFDITNCNSIIWEGVIYDSTGVYTNIYNANGCDSVVILNLTINYAESSSIWQTGNELFAISSNNNSIEADWYNIQTQNEETRIWLMQEQSSSFIPTFDCSYFLIYENDFGCIDTSSIYYYSENAKRIGTIITSPNPTSNIVKAQFDNPKNQNVKLELINSNGIKLDEFFTTYDNLDIDLSKYPSGTYYLYFNSEDAVQGCRLEELQKISSKIILNK